MNKATKDQLKFFDDMPNSSFLKKDESGNLLGVALNLQAITNEGNTSTNAMTISGNANQNVTGNGLLLTYNAGLAQLVGISNNAINTSILMGSSEINLHAPWTVSTAYRLKLRPQTTANAGAVFQSRVAGQNATLDNEFVTLAQLNSATPNLSFGNGLRNDGGTIRLGANAGYTAGLLSEVTWLTTANPSTNDHASLIIGKISDINTTQLVSRASTGVHSFLKMTPGDAILRKTINNAVQALDFNADGHIYLEDGASTRGIEYKANYSANFTARSLVDKDYVDTAISSIGASTLQAVTTIGNTTSNAITISGNANQSITQNGLLLTYNAGLSQMVGIVEGAISTSILMGTAEISFHTPWSSSTQYRLRLRTQTTADAGAHFRSRVRGDQAVNSDEFPTLAQVQALNVITSLNEGSGIGYRIAGRNAANYGNIGLGAVDLAISDVTSTVNGATGEYSLTTGKDVIAGGNNSFAGGYRANASGYNSMAFGRDITNYGYAALVIGQYNNPILSAQETTWTTGSPLFIAGNGTSTTARNAYVLYNDGKSTQGGVASYAANYASQFTARSIIDRGYLESQSYGSSIDFAGTTGNGVDVDLNNLPRAVNIHSASFINGPDQMVHGFIWNGHYAPSSAYAQILVEEIPGSNAFYWRIKGGALWDPWYKAASEQWMYQWGNPVWLRTQHIPLLQSFSKGIQKQIAGTALPGSSVSFTANGFTATARFPSNPGTNWDWTTPLILVIYWGGTGDADTAIPPNYVTASNNTRIVVVRCVMDQPSGANYGNPNALTTAKAIYDYMVTNYTISGVVLAGHSMGAVGALNCVTRNIIPNVVGLYLTDPVCSLRQRWDNGGTPQQYIRQAYGIATDGSDYAEKTAGYDPLLERADRFKGLYISCVASTGDTTIPYTEHLAKLRDKLAHYNNIEATILSSAGHSQQDRFIAAQWQNFMTRVQGGSIGLPNVI